MQIGVGTTQCVEQFVTKMRPVFIVQKQLSQNEFWRKKTVTNLVDWNYGLILLHTI